MHCPHCDAEPPRDPFVCTHCGEQLLTYLDEPLGPGTGIRPEALGRAADARQQPTSHQEPVGAGVAVRQERGEERQRSWLERQIDPHPTAGQERQPGAPGGPTADDRRGARSPGQPADLTGAMIGKVAFGILVAVCVMIVSPVSGVLMLGAVALFLFRWPRAPFVAYAGAMIAVAAGLWIVVEILDEADIPALFPSPTPTPTIQRAFATPTRPIATPNLAPAQQTATATAVVGQNVARISRARARWLRGDYAAARAELDAALTAMPGQRASHNLRALVRIAAGDVQGGVADAEAAVTASSQAIFRDTRAYAYLKVGRYDDAAADYDRILSGPSTESHTANYLGRGIARSAQGKLVEARADLETGLRLLPDTPPDPQLADLEMLARQALDPMAPRPGTPTPIPSPGAQPAATPAASPVTPPVAPPVASPVALRGDASLPGRAP